MASCSIANEPPTVNERLWLEREARLDVSSLAYAVAFASVAAFGLGLIAGWIGSLIGVDKAISTWVGRALGLAILVYTSVSFSRFLARARRRGQEDLGRNQVEVIRVRDARSLEIDAGHSSVTPMLAFDIGDGKLLLVAGQWLQDPETYGAPLVEDDHQIVESTINGLPAPHAFPSADFTIRRAVASGSVFSIQVESEYRAPEGMIALDLRRSSFDGSSQVVRGSLSDVRAALQIKAGH